MGEYTGVRYLGSVKIIKRFVLFVVSIEIVLMIVD